MRRPAAMLLAILAALTLLAVPVSAAAPFPSRIDLPNGWRPEGIAAGPGTTAFVGSLADGSIARVNLRTGAVDPDFVEGPGLPAVGLFYDREAGRLFAAGGPSGQVRVYDGRTGDELETYQFTAGFVNDVVVTPDRRLRDRFADPAGARDPDRGRREPRRPGRCVRAADHRRLRLPGRVQRQRHRVAERPPDRPPVQHRRAVRDRSRDRRQRRAAAGGLDHGGRRHPVRRAPTCTSSGTSSTRSTCTGSRAGRRCSSGRSTRPASTSRRRSPSPRAGCGSRTPGSARRPRRTRRTGSPGSARLTRA